MRFCSPLDKQCNLHAASYFRDSPDTLHHVDVSTINQRFVLYIRTVMEVPDSTETFCFFNPLKPELNPICYLLALLAHHFLHV